jgi:hypothetical protein
MEATLSSETSVLTRPTQHNISGDGILYPLSFPMGKNVFLLQMRAEKHSEGLNCTCTTETKGKAEFVLENFTFSRTRPFNKSDGGFCPEGASFSTLTIQTVLPHEAEHFNQGPFSFRCILTSSSCFAKVAKKEGAPVHGWGGGSPVPAETAALKTCHVSR